MSVDVLDIYAPGSRPTTLIDRAKRALDAGELVVLPTETVYGAAGRLDRPSALDKLQTLRGKNTSGPFTIHLPHADAAAPFLGDTKPPGTLARRMMQKLWPGPVAFIFEVAPADRVAIAGRLGLGEGELFASDGTITLRCPDHPLATHILESVDGPVALTRVDTRSGDEPFADPAVLKPLENVVSFVLDAGRTRFAKPSTIVRLDGESYRVVREGVFDQRIIERQLKTLVLFVCSGNTCRSPMASALATKILRDQYKLKAGESLESKGITVASAGTFAVPGLRATPQGVDAVAAFGADLSAHRSQILTPELLHAADFVFTMGRSHMQAVTAMSPAVAARVMPLDPQRDVEDPIGGDLSLYRSLAEKFQSLITHRLEETVLKLHPPEGQP